MMHRLGLASLRNRRFVFDGLFLLNVYKGLINCESLLHDIGFKARTHNIRDKTIFFLSKHSYFLRCSNSENSLCNHSDIFNVNKLSTATFTEIVSSWLIDIEVKSGDCGGHSVGPS